MTGGVTIGQAAAFAGMTVKTVRHYHRRGLIEEPRRDTSGYRRYGSADLLRLVHIRTLAGAGVPLAEIGAILDADPDRFATALVDVERRLTDGLTGGDRLVTDSRVLVQQTPEAGQRFGTSGAARDGASAPGHPSAAGELLKGHVRGARPRLVAHEARDQAGASGSSQLQHNGQPRSADFEMATAADTTLAKDNA